MTKLNGKRLCQISDQFQKKYFSLAICLYSLKVIYRTTKIKDTQNSLRRKIKKNSLLFYICHLVKKLNVLGIPQMSCEFELRIFIKIYLFLRPKTENAVHLTNHLTDKNGRFKTFS